MAGNDLNKKIVIEFETKSDTKDLEKIQNVIQNIKSDREINVDINTIGLKELERVRRELILTKRELTIEKAKASKEASKEDKTDISDKFAKEIEKINKNVLELDKTILKLKQPGVETADVSARLKKGLLEKKESDESVSRETARTVKLIDEFNKKILQDIQKKAKFEEYDIKKKISDFSKEQNIAQKESLRGNTLQTKQMMAGPQKSPTFEIDEMITNLEDQNNEMRKSNSLFKDMRSAMTGVLIDFHILRIVGQHSKVVASSFKILTDMVGALLDVALLPLLPILTILVTGFTQVIGWVMALSGPFRNLLAFIVAAGVVFIGLMGTIRAVKWALETLALRDVVKRASGGPIAAGQYAVVGERGPELIVPRGPVDVIPNHKLRFAAEGTGFNVPTADFGGIMGGMGGLFGGIMSGIATNDSLRGAVTAVAQGSAMLGAVLAPMSGAIMGVAAIGGGITALIKLTGRSSAGIQEAVYSSGRSLRSILTIIAVNSGVLPLILLALGAIGLLLQGIKIPTIDPEMWKGVWEGLKEAFSKFVEWLKEGFRKVWDAITKKLSDLWEKIKAKFGEIWEKVKEGALKIWEGIKDSAIKAWEAIKTKGLEVWSKIKEVLDPILERLKFKEDSPIRKTLGEMIDYLKEKFGGAKERVGRAVERAKEFGGKVKERVGEGYEWAKESNRRGMKIADEAFGFKKVGKGVLEDLTGIGKKAKESIPEPKNYLESFSDFWKSHTPEMPKIPEVKPGKFSKLWGAMGGAPAMLAGGLLGAAEPLIRGTRAGFDWGDIALKGGLGAGAMGLFNLGMKFPILSRMLPVVGGAGAEIFGEDIGKAAEYAITGKEESGWGKILGGLGLGAPMGALAGPGGPIGYVGKNIWDMYSSVANMEERYKKYGPEGMGIENQRIFEPQGMGGELVKKFMDLYKTISDGLSSIDFAGIATKLYTDIMNSIESSAKIFSTLPQAIYNKIYESIGNVVGTTRENIFKTGGNVVNTVNSFLSNVPKLDSGGFISQTGLAVVHKGETVSKGGDTVNTFNNTFYISGNSDKDIVDKVIRELQLQSNRIRGF